MIIDIPHRQALLMKEYWIANKERWNEFSKAEFPAENGVLHLIDCDGGEKICLFVTPIGGRHNCGLIVTMTHKEFERMLAIN